VSDFTITDGVAKITNPELFSTWHHRPDYVEALAASPDAEIGAKKRLFLEFEAALGRMAVAGSVKEDLEGILERYVGEPYIQHDPNIADGKDGLREFFGHGGYGDSPPIPVCVTVDGDLISVVLQTRAPDPTNPDELYDLFFVSLFRVRDGKFVEHWDSMSKMAMEPERQH
jgi:predicted SnoaL-like aldol condensation-catalyzing enzyme